MGRSHFDYLCLGDEHLEFIMRRFYIKKIISSGVILAVLIFYGSSFLLGTSPQSQLPKVKESPEKIQPEEISAGPRNIKEKTAVFVFLGWLWLSILVLIYFLQQKIKEVDRLQAMKFFEAERKFKVNHRR